MSFARTLFLVVTLLAILPARARALTTSDNALRIENSSDGSLLLGAEKAVLDKGEIYKTIVLLWGSFDVYGEVDEVVVLSGHVTFHEGSRLNKSLTVMGGSFESKPGAQVAAENVVTEVPGLAWRVLLSAANTWRDNIGWVSKVLGGLLLSVISWLLAWSLFHGFPGLQANTSGMLMSEWPKNLVIAMLGMFLSFFGMIVLLVSVIGWLLIPFYILGLLFSSLVAYAAAALWAGHRLLPPKEGRRINPLGFLLGFLAFLLLWSLPVSMSALPVLLLWTLAWGALLRSLRLLWR